MNVLAGKLRKVAFAIAACAAAFMVGCTQNVGDIDRTQSLRISKEQFSGVWYYVQTVADVPFSTAWTFQGEMNFGTGAKIVFDIQEDMLIAYPVVETVDGVEADYQKIQMRRFWDKDRRDEFIEIYVGQPMAAWKIVKHFDVIRDYNESTGEQSNVIVENAEDRPWWERDYIRVDWNNQMLVKFGFVSGTAEATALHYVEESEQDPLNPDAPEYEPDYISVVNKYYTTPSYSGCSLYVLGSADCTAATIKVRHSFKKADSAEDVVVRRYTNREHQEKFGYFLSERHDYDEWYGYTESARDYKAQLWNLWQNSQTFEPFWDGDGQSIPCNTQVDCPSGTRCVAEEWFDGGVCSVATPVPYRERGLHPVIYHLSPGHPGLSPALPVVDEDGAVLEYSGGAVVKSDTTGYVHPLIVEAYETADQWSRAFKETVAWLYLHEELGTLHVADKREGARACSNHDDCITGSPSVKLRMFADTAASVQLMCASNNDCDAPYSCESLGAGCEAGAEVCNVCAERVSCGAQPCPFGTVCGDDGFCRDDAGELLLDIGSNNTRLSYTFVVYATEDGEVRGNRLIDRQYPEDVPTQTVNSNALVRFVNATPGTTVSLRAVLSDPADNSGDSGLETETWFTGVGESADDAEAQAKTLGYRSLYYDESKFPYYVADLGQKVRRLEVVSGNSVLAKVHNVTLSAGKSYTVVFAGGDSVIVADAFSNAQGIQVINAVPTDIHAGIDAGIGSRLLGRGLEYGAVVPHTRPITDGINNFVVLAAGAAGDVTCFNDNGFGKCVGWGPEVTEATETRLAEILGEVQEMFVLCEPIYHGDDCAPDDIGNMSVFNDCRYSVLQEDGTITNPCKDLVAHPKGLKKIGDIRYNTFYWVGKAQASSPLGYGPSAADPEYGKTFHAAANLYGASMITYGNYAKDLLDLINGTLTVEEVMSGAYVEEFIKSKKKEWGGNEDLEVQQNPLMLGTSLSGQGHGHSHGPLVLDDLPALDFLRDKLPAPGPVADKMQFVQNYLLDPAFKVKILPPQHPGYHSSRQARLDMLRGTPIEDMLLTDEVKVALSGGAYSPGMAVPDDAKSQLSLAAYGGEGFLKAHSAREYLLSRNNICMGDFSDDSLAGLADELGCTTDKLEQGVIQITDFVEAHRRISENREATGIEELPADYCLSGEALAMIVTARMYGGVLEHEVGHTVGLRHNFSGSADIFNFFDEWYDIRERDKVLCIDDGGCNFGFGEICVQDCTSDAECPAQALCEGGFCVDKSDARGDRVGWCMGASKEPVAEEACTFNPNTVTPPADVFSWSASDGVCQIRTYCSENTQCTKGFTCDSGLELCVPTDPFADFEPALAVETSCTSDEECSGGGRCIEGSCFTAALRIVPRPRMTATESAKKRTEWQLSTVMDYGQKINADIHGLGKYDYAAIKFGYGDLVEVYKDTSHIQEFIEGASTQGLPPDTLSFYTTPSSWNAALISPHFFINYVLGVENTKSSNRTVMPWQQVKLERAANFDFTNENLNSSYHEVPYEFCSDEFRGSYQCYTWDTGVDHIEIVEAMNDQLREYYYFDAFMRDRYSFRMESAAMSYYGRVLDRYMMPMRNSGLYHALYANIFAGFGDFWSTFVKEPMSGMHYGRPAFMSFQYLQDVVSSPAPGTYEFDPAKNAYVNISYDDIEGEGLLKVPFGIGKFPYTTYDAKYGYNMWKHPIFVGSYWEKLAAMVTLTANDTTFLADYVSEDFDVGISSAIGFTSVFPTEIANLFGGIVASDLGYWAGVVDDFGEGMEFRPRSAFLPGVDDGLPSVEPAINNLNLKVLAGVYAMTQIPAAFDTSVSDSLAVVFKGNGSAYELADGMDWVEFVDPFSDKTYLALAPKYDDNRIPAAKALVDRANELKESWLTAESTEEAEVLGEQLKEVVKVLDVLRALNETFSLIEF
jgi:hypothetical protein